MSAVSARTLLKLASAVRGASFARSGTEAIFVIIGSATSRLPTMRRNAATFAVCAFSVKWLWHPWILADDGLPIVTFVPPKNLDLFAGPEVNRYTVDIQANQEGKGGIRFGRRNQALCIGCR